MPRVHPLHRSSTVVDAHNDLILLVARRENAAERAGYFRDHWVPQLRTGGVDVQVLPVYMEPEYLPEGALRRTVLLLEELHGMAAANADEVAVCGTGAEIRAAVAEGRIALVPALEGSAAVGPDVDIVRVLHRLGVRIIAFAHFGRTTLADGSFEQDAGSSLTRLGVEALAVMEELGVLMDVSHLSFRGIDHVLEIARRPVIASHSSARAVCDHHRNVTDEQARGIAATGGVVGVNFFPGFIDPDEPTVDRIVDHVEHLVSVVGVDHVGLGPDFIKEYIDERYPTGPVDLEGLDVRATIKGLEGPADLPLLTETLLARGFTEDAVTKILGGNFLRVFDDVLGRPS